MRKVKPEDEIPIEDLSHSAINRRLKNINNTTISLDLQRKLKSLNTYMVKTSNSENPNIEVNKIVKRIYKLSDQLVDETLKGQHVCRKGCAHCCKVPVTVTALEMAYIHNHLDIPVKSLTESKNPVSAETYCPLLDQKTGLCTAYEFRPLNCRTFFSIDTPSECEDVNNSHYQFKVDGSGALKFLHDILFQLSKQSDFATYADIREWLG